MKAEIKPVFNNIGESSELARCICLWLGLLLNMNVYSLHVEIAPTCYICVGIVNIA